MSGTAKLFKNASSQAVRLSRAFRLSGNEAAIHRDWIILKPLVRARWPRGFFSSIRITDQAFVRPPQGELPAPVDLGA
jgi:virulence-associated protein VagC